MSGNACYNGQIPTDPILALFLLLVCIAYAHTLNYEQAQAIAATGAIADLGVLLFRLFSARR